METEMLNIFTQDGRPLGTAPRDEVHRLGYWHETFHCWVTGTQDGEDVVYVQRRSPDKKDYPDLFDITAAGHLTADETVRDGTREMAEEIGLEVDFDELQPLGIIPYSIRQSEMIDNERAHVFLYHTGLPLEDFRVQPEEVVGLSAVAIRDFAALWRGQQDTVPSRGFVLNSDGNSRPVAQQLSRTDFVPHPDTYYSIVLKGLEEAERARRS
ncbi:putative Nudix hydrolase [Sporosarcina sp. NCCP-2716]|uniref:NUDIX hydrolase n=1 Tax=Sporosarcina sp. NCCP-2716 TaxID=2943679 RepID=UPI00203CA888|nr:NUDIX domain-containing protein [Sporosarcina sp. NCCP-2716]GKV69776.1 putative Nudix hydrolase [Sporosarcina sp. NCCP-2716]